MKETYRNIPNSGVPLGGLGTGTVELRPGGRFHNWQIFNNPPWTPAAPIATRRSGLRNSARKFLRDQAGRVAFIGGSITVCGWSNLTQAHLGARFPEMHFDVVNAAIGGTNSTFGAFRFDDHVLARGPVDLLFLEFAVNDGGAESPSSQRIQAMEGIIRKARRANPPGERAYTCTFRGSTCVDVSPKDTAPTSFPFYARAGLRTAQTPMKKVERFVPDRIVEAW